MRWKRGGILVIACVLALLEGKTDATALTCGFTVSWLNFGDVYVISNGSGTRTTTGNVQVVCSGNPNQDVTICPNIGPGSGSPGSYNPRQMERKNPPLEKLDFNIYWPSQPNIWGTLSSPYPPPIWHIQLDGSGQRTVNYPMPAKLFGGLQLQTARPGTYRSKFGSYTDFQFKAGNHPNCSPPDGTRHPGFRARVKIMEECVVSASDLDFGTAGLLNNPVDATSTITVQCSNTIPYKIRIDAGQGGATTPTNRKMSNGSHTIIYGIYRDAARTQGWGWKNSNDVNATGTGLTQTYTAYGRVFAQPTPPPGTYTDTLTVIVKY